MIAKHILISALVAGATFGAAALGCSSNDTPTSSNPGSTSNDAGSTPVDRGASIAAANGCADCHGTNYAGKTTGVDKHPTAFAPNLTPDTDTGIGGWSDDQVAGAITKGTDDEGQSLCVMPVYSSLKADEVSALVAFLRSLPPVKQDIPETDCSGETDGGSK